MWTLKEELSRSLQQWHLLLAFFVLGAGLGWAAASFVPTSYQATSSLYIGLETYRAYSDPAFSAYANQEHSNQDDYKNWQMSQLNELILANDFIETTLMRLRKGDSGWEQVSRAELRSMLNAEWRSAGKWSLIATHADLKRAVQAVQAWQAVVLEKTAVAISKAQEMIKSDMQLQALREQETQAKVRYLEHQTALKRIDQLKQELQTAQTPLPLAMRWAVLLPASRTADFTPAWLALLNEQPSPAAYPQAYLDWLLAVETMLKEESNLLLVKREEFNRQFKVSYVKYLLALKDSRGLSPNLLVEETGKEDEPQITQPRNNALFAFVGGLLGFLGFLFFRIISVRVFTLKSRM